MGTRAVEGRRFPGFSGGFDGFGVGGRSGVFVRCEAAGCWSVRAGAVRGVGRHRGPGCRNSGRRGATGWLVAAGDVGGRGWVEPSRLPGFW